MEDLILKNVKSEIHFDKKMVNHNSGGFILTTKFYKSGNNSAILDPMKCYSACGAVYPEGTAAKNQ